MEPGGVGQSVSKSSVYWSTASGFDTMYALFNPTEKATDVLLKLAYGGSSTYNYPVHLQPGATAMADIKQIAMMGMPDSSGKVLPLSVEQGSAVLTALSGNDADPINVVISVGIYNPATATCGRTCQTCNGCTSFPSALTPGTLGLPVSTYAWFYAQCPWYNGNTQTISSYSTSWSSDNTGIATVQANPNPGLSYGNDAGSANISTQLVAVPVNIGQICTQGTLPACGTSSPVQSGAAAVRPFVGVGAGPTNILGSNADAFAKSTCVDISASSSPSGGTFSRTSSSSKVQLSNASTATVHVCSQSQQQSGAAGDVPLSVSYTVGGQTATASTSLTVLMPSSLSTPASDTTTGNAHTCVSGTGTSTCANSYYCDANGVSYTSYLRTRQYNVLDQFGNVIGLNMDINESYSPSVNVITGSGAGATLTDCFYFCSQACRLGQSASLSSTQTILTNGQQIGTKSVSWTCSGATVTP